MLFSSKKGLENGLEDLFGAFRLQTQQLGELTERADRQEAELRALRAYAEGLETELRDLRAAQADLDRDLGAVRSELVHQSPELTDEDSHRHETYVKQMRHLCGSRFRDLARSHADLSGFDVKDRRYPYHQARLVSELVSACFAEPTVNESAFRALLEPEAKPSRFGDRDRQKVFYTKITRLLRDTTALRAEIAGSAHPVEFDFSVPDVITEDTVGLWHPSSIDRPVVFVVIPAYLVRGQVFGNPVVFTEVP
ncbi:hypothetical protein AGRA3207_002866 [Actinomadura graeca]|uniref:Uncharacterized protein n=1 Tax=Actinomadura graeca TaxID=2750812 RepID=A0ABX8QUR1_9ACTN|nr:hypothetical protein [Actinomadura graeca]QXJ21949.1 hypothetical protein AGRA3207_002866 [Actinomadura graeca]